MRITGGTARGIPLSLPQRGESRPAKNQKLKLNKTKPISHPKVAAHERIDERVH